MIKLDETVVRALRHAVSALQTSELRPVPADVLAPLIDVARPGLRLHLDLAASRSIGAPLITVSQLPDSSALLAGLTPRQTEVACLVIDGLSNRAIASRLGISVATVKDHVHAILDRLGMSGRTALIAAARHPGSA